MEKTRPFAYSVSSRVSRALRKAASKKLSAFTLVELIVVITILAILATIGFLALSGYTQDAKDASVKANVRSIYSAIAAESALTGNSPRSYVVHDTGAALSDGALAFVDGSPVTLTGGAYGTAGTNYSAGNPDWTKLKLNPEKFRISGSGLPGGTASIAALASGFGTAGAAYDAKLVTVGALDAALAQTANGRSRSNSFFQVAGVAPETGIAWVVGNFPAPTAAQVASSGATAGLVKAPTGTGALIDGATSEASGGGVSAPEPTLSDWGDSTNTPMNYLLASRPASQFTCYSGTCPGTTGVVYDTITGLYWQSRISDSTMNWSPAKEYCATLSLGGFDDWRMPDVNELASIVDYSQSDGANRWYASKFNLYAQYVWSSVTDTDGAGGALALRFDYAINGNIIGTQAKSNNLYVICTR